MGGVHPPKSDSVSPNSASTQALKAPVQKGTEHRCILEEEAGVVRQQPKSVQIGTGPGGTTVGIPPGGEEAEDLVPVTSEAEEEDRDDDGAIYFRREEGFSEGRKARIAPEVPPPSAEMMRRHKASGHCPYRAWCKDCVMGACNLPAHPARKALDPGATPELHGDYAFLEIVLEKKRRRALYS